MGSWHFFFLFCLLLKCVILPEICLLYLRLVPKSFKFFLFVFGLINSLKIFNRTTRVLLNKT